MDFDLPFLARQLQFCNTQISIHQGRQIHVVFLKMGLLCSPLSLRNRLLQMYTRCDSMVDAHRLFEEMPLRNCFSWNTMIEGYLKLGDEKKSLELFKSMPSKNDFSWNVIVSGLLKFGRLETARSLFDDMPRRNMVVWNSMIHGYARYGCPSEALRLFKELNEEPLEVSIMDNFVLATVFRACTDLLALDQGKQIHARFLVDKVEFDSVLASSLINFYGKCGDLDSANHVLNMIKEPDDFSLSALVSAYVNCSRCYDAKRIFDRKHDPGVILWNTMISGYVSNGEEMEALSLFNNMRSKGVEQDSSTLASIISAGNSFGSISHIKQMHILALKVGLVDDVVVASSLIDAYSKCGKSDEACKLFKELKYYDTILLNSMITMYSNSGRIKEAKMVFKTMSDKSLVSWNSMIVALSQNGRPMEAIDLLCEMNKLGLEMDKFNMASVISSCGCISLLELGKQIFAKAIVSGLESDRIISTSLVDFYSKCGLFEQGRKIFDGMVKVDEISWNSMIIGYATNGHGMEALNLFNEMRKANVIPSGITFTGVLSACNHCGLVEEGRKWFATMKKDYNINPSIEHYSCMVDLFARAGCLQEAVNLIENMSFEADVSMWSAVLRGCVEHGNRTVGKMAAEKIIEFEPHNSGAHVQLASILAAIGDWEGSAKIRKAMREKKIQKNPGYSWADTGTIIAESVPAFTEIRYNIFIDLRCWLHREDKEEIKIMPSIMSIHGDEEGFSNVKFDFCNWLAIRATFWLKGLTGMSIDAKAKDIGSFYDTEDRSCSIYDDLHNINYSTHSHRFKNKKLKLKMKKTIIVGFQWNVQSKMI